MKILNILFKQNLGGVGQAFLDYGNSLTKQGNEVAIAISKKDRLNADYSNFVETYKFNNLSPILDSIKLLLTIKQLKPDIIICHDPRSIRLACNVKKLIKAPIVGVNHGWGYKQSLCCDYIFNVNEPIRQKTIEAGFDESKTLVVSNMIDMQGFGASKKFNFHDPIRIGMIGRIDSGKGFDILIRALSILKKHKVNFVAKFGGFTIGNEDYLEKLKDEIKEKGLTKKIEFLGKINDKKSFYESIDILTVPSRSESFGLVILEGFKHSTPVISSETDGAKILIQNNENGLTFPICNHLELSKRIEFLIKQPEFANKLVKNGFATAKEKYSSERVAKDINSKLEKIVKQSK
jgi:glycosyltransferase involved in cell wall biosynthesis